MMPLPAPTPQPILGDVDPTVFFVVWALFAIAFTLFVLRVRRDLRKSNDPGTILHDCREGLKLVRRELERIPATREAHALYAQLESTERTIDETEAVLARGSK